MVEEWSGCIRPDSLILTLLEFSCDAKVEGGAVVLGLYGPPAVISDPVYPVCQDLDVSRLDLNPGSLRAWSKARQPQFHSAESEKCVGHVLRTSSGDLTDISCH